MPTKTLAGKTRLEYARYFYILNQFATSHQLMTTTTKLRQKLHQYELVTNDISQSDVFDKLAIGDTLHMQFILSLVPKVVKLMQSVGRYGDFATMAKAILGKTKVWTIFLYTSCQTYDNFFNRIRFIISGITKLRSIVRPFSINCSIIGNQARQRTESRWLICPKGELGSVQPRECIANSIVPSHNTMKRECDRCRSKHAWT